MDNKKIVRKEMADQSWVSEWYDSKDLLNQLIVILVGVTLLGVNLGWIDASVVSYWPIVLIVIGLRALLHNN